MKTQVLISSIIRNRANQLPNYFAQIEKFIDILKDNYEFSISLYENDSTDLSKTILINHNYSKFKYHYIQMENIGTFFFPSVNHPQRVANFANARNKTIEVVDLNQYDYMLIIEPDIIYDPVNTARIITREDLQDKDIDVYSGMSVSEGDHEWAHDCWAMRRNEHEDGGKYFPDYKENPIREFWATANGVCLYKMEPFKRGLKFDYINKRWNRYDCDTAVLCEDIRAMGFNKIFVHQGIKCFHPD